MKHIIVMWGEYQPWMCSLAEGNNGYGTYGYGGHHASKRPGMGQGCVNSSKGFGFSDIEEVKEYNEVVVLKGDN